MSPIRRLYSGTSPLGINHGMRIRSSAHDVTAPTSQRHPPAVHPIGTSHLGLQIALRPRSFLADHRRGVVMPWRPLVKRMDMSSSASASHIATMSVTESPVTLYWRPECPYCLFLRFKLRRCGISVREVNIWEDPSGAALVREIAGGSETVPTVTVGDVAMVNPSARRVIDELVRVAPALVDRPSSARSGRPRSRWRARRSR